MDNTFKKGNITLINDHMNFLGQDIGFKSKEAISELLGHSDIQITKVYLNDNKELLKSLIK